MRPGQARGRLPLSVGRTILALTLFALPACAPGDGNRPSGGKPPPGLALTVVVGATDVGIVRRSPHDTPIEPLPLRDTTVGRELLVALYDKNGENLAFYEWPADGLEFYHHRPTDAAPENHLEHNRSNMRMIDFPFASDTAYLVLAVTSPGQPDSEDSKFPCNSHGVRCDYSTVAEAPRIIESLAVYPVMDVAPTAATKIGFEGSGPGVPRFSVTPGYLRHPLATWIPDEDVCPYSDGELENTKLLHGTNETARRYDVVIMGDGFTTDELPAFDGWAERYKTALLSIEPFKRLQDKINIHSVRTSSPESNVTHCPDEKTRRSYYRVEGEWIDPVDGEGGNGFFGTDAHCRIWESAEEIGPLHEIDLLVMIVNCNVYGGKAEPWSNLIYITTYEEEGKFEKLALHESGHTIALLGEEYIACADLHPHYRYPEYFPNVVPKAEMDNAWWKGLLNDDELKDGKFRAVHTCEDAFTKDSFQHNVCTPIMENDASPKMLGLYWGAIYGEESSTERNQCHVYCGQDAAGKPTGLASCEHFRPMKTCHMRDINEPFCRACEELLCHAVREVDPETIHCKLDSIPSAAARRRTTSR